MDIKFTKTHEWVRVDDLIATVGITEHAQHLLGDLVYVELPAIHKTLQAGAELGVVESVKAASDVYSPVSGTVIEINEALQDNPALVNSSPQEQGWLVKLQLENTDELVSLLGQEAYDNQVTEE